MAQAELTTATATIEPAVGTNVVVNVLSQTNILVSVAAPGQAVASVSVPGTLGVGRIAAGGDVDLPTTIIPLGGGAGGIGGVGGLAPNGIALSVGGAAAGPAGADDNGRMLVVVQYN